MSEAESSSAVPHGLSAKQQKLFELRMRMNEGRKMNHQEVAAEKRRSADPAGEAKRQRELSEQKREKRKAEAAEMEEEEEEDNDDRNSWITLEQADGIEKKKAKKEKNKAACGWDIFNQDSLHKAHKKRLATMKVDLEGYKAQKAEQGDDVYRDANSLAFGQAGYQPPQEKVEAMVTELLDKQEKRNKFSRRRGENEDDGVDYINDRNKHFNKKIERAFGEYTKVIKSNLERGTAL
uniref:Pre-mRNA-splicing factor SYF2 n=1 Tax=Hemiselmis andersenii TaxID=464988 RepID=A0A6U4PM38_HEMAN|mmetsp:Transcript_22251/g.51015  ORF Transcript_22251/g.51015 Transcript_22251/m.51015 type:complete len:236 (+) Transcript_22251:28-735(+)